MDSKSHNLQMTLRFTDKYCDVLCFISPRVLNEKNENFDVLKTINTINWYIKLSLQGDFILMIIMILYIV